MSLQKKIIIGLFLSIAFLALYIWLAVLPFLNKIDRSFQDYKENQKNVAKLEKKSFLVKDLKQNYIDNKKSLSKIDGVLLKQKETVGLISTLEKIAKESGNKFEINRATPSDFDKKNEDKISCLNLDLTLAGSFNSLLVFLAYLEDSPYPPYRLIEIEDLVISKSQKTNFTASNLQGAESNSEEPKELLQTNLSIKVYTND